MESFPHEICNKTSSPVRLVLLACMLKFEHVGSEEFHTITY